MGADIANSVWVISTAVETQELFHYCQSIVSSHLKAILKIDCRCLIYDGATGELQHTGAIFGREIGHCHWSVERYASWTFPYLLSVSVLTELSQLRPEALF